MEKKENQIADGRFRALDAGYWLVDSSRLVFWSLVGWLISVGLFYPFGFKSVEWVYSLLLLAVFVFVPIGHKLYQQIQVGWVYNPLYLWFGAIALAVAFQLELGILTVSLALPWLLLSAYYAIQSITFACKNNLCSVKDWCFTGSFIFLLVGATWAFADRLGYRPLGFDSIIVLLTAIHFHYAGFLMPLLTGLILQEKQNKRFDLVAWGILLGIPLVAIGITASEFNWPSPLEVSAATIMALSGMAVALLYLRKALVKLQTSKKAITLLIGSLCLLSGMVLAILYGWRYYFPLPFLSIPWMYAVHGSLNVLGVGLLITSYWLTGVFENNEPRK